MIDDPLFLQVKEATRSVLESHLPKTRFHTPGQRVVEGQRMMQAAPDIFLGWTKGVQEDRFYYWRQLRDMKASAVVETMTPIRMSFYARICGWSLARAHARSGDPVAIAAYLGPETPPTRVRGVLGPVRRPEQPGLRSLRPSRQGRPDRRRRRSLRPPWILSATPTPRPCRYGPSLPRGLMIAIGIAAVLVAALGIRRSLASSAPCFSRSSCRSPFNRCAASRSGTACRPGWARC